VRQLSAFGFRGSREARFPATNAKLGEYSAAVGLAGLDAWSSTRLRFCAAAQRLRIALALVPSVTFQAGWGLGWVSSVCVVGLPPGSADHVEANLSDDGVDVRRWWGHGCHRSPAFAGFPCTETSNTDALATSTLGLPFAVDMTEAETAQVAGALAQALEG
jgi:dTDP-4-amino-4,6-dideoxygalactose transaminase